MNNNIIAKNTVILAVNHIFLQVMSLLLNIFITHKLGASSVGITSLIYTFYGFTSVIATGNIFVSSSRFISEELAKPVGNPNRIFSFALIFCMVLSLVVSSVVFIFSGYIGTNILKTPETITSIKIISLCLPLSAVCSCTRGYFHANQKILIPSIADIIEFFIRAGIIAFLASYMVASNKMVIYTAIAISIFIAEIAGSSFMLISFLYHKKSLKNNNKTSINFFKFTVSTVPIMLNSYIISALSSTNDALVPLTLKQFSGSTELALSQYGIFEAIILPTIFFPAVVLSCLSNVLAPEISKKRISDENNVKHLIEKTLRQTFAFSIFVVALMLSYGKEIGTLLSGNEFAGNVIVTLAPAIPFIYLEIILEGILRGLGKHSFSTINYLAEYIIRISVLLICVPLIGFYGIVISYFASNIVCNIIRMTMVMKITGFNFNSVYLILLPVFSSVVSWQLGMLTIKLLNIQKLPVIIEICFYVIITGIFYLFIQKVIFSMKERKNTVPESYSITTITK